MSHYSSIHAKSMALSSARKSLMLRLNANNIGFEVISRKEYIQTNVNYFANRLYNLNPEIPRGRTYCEHAYLDTAIASILASIILYA